MKITKFVHACLLVETDDRVVLFDPGMMSEQALDVSKLNKLDDIFITHEHPDHKSFKLLHALVERFPDVRITSTNETVEQLKAEGIVASNTEPDGVEFFESPHENVTPVYPQPEEVGIHYLDVLTHPGDSHHFIDTKAILALPMTGPWGAMINAVALALTLKPQHVLPIHDWHWNDTAREQTYKIFQEKLGEQGIIFHPLQTGQPITIDTASLH